jgi:photosystem II stability/assembly factor-like uncharacterized protein
MIIALSHGGPTIYSSPSRSRQVLIATAEGVVAIERDEAGTWAVAGRSLTDHHICAILVEPDSGVIFAGSHDGSLFRSRDGGVTWQLSDNGLTETNIYSLGAAKVDGRTRVFAGTEPARLYYSDDLGDSWTELSAVRSVPSVGQWSFPAPPHAAHAKHITFDPNDASTMYLSIEVGALLKSNDGGRTWQELHGMYEDVHRLVINPADPRRMYVSGGNGLYVSADGGESWEHRTDTKHPIGGYPDQLLLSPKRPELMFVASSEQGPGSWRTSHYAGTRISRSEDGGATWSPITNGMPERLQSSIEAMSLEEWGDSFSVFAATTSGEVFASEDGGESWSLIVDGLAPISKAGHYRQLTPAAV